MTRFLVTGGGGFVGQWLTRSLIARGDDVTLAGLGAFSDHPTILSAAERHAVRWLSCDVSVQADVDAMVDAARPDVVMHLAGVAFPPDAERNPAKTYDINSLGVVRLLAALARVQADGALGTTVVVVGSGVQYGAHPASDAPLTEDAAQRPLSVYAASKAAQEIAALQAARAHGLRVVCTRSFNHSGVGHGKEYLLPSLVARVKDISATRVHSLPIGSDVVRDYLHVRDVVDAYLALAERGVAGEVYNVSSGIGLSVRQLATDVLLRAGVHAEISTAASFVRASDIPVLVGSPAKLTRDTGWAPSRTHFDIIDDLLHAAPN
jgi:GDP-4-dehydro-6-deoxy-D-mannose reductase